MTSKNQRTKRNLSRPFRESAREVNRRFDKALRLARKGRHTVRVTTSEGVLLSEEMCNELHN